MLFSVEGRTGREVHEDLAARGVNAPASSFYALEASRWMGLGDTGAVRAGLAPYTSEDDVDRLLAGVAELRPMSRRVLVTGASRGIGAAVAAGVRGRRATGWRCTTAGPATRPTQVLAGLPGDGHVLVQADLADPDAVRRGVDEAAAGLGGLDVLVNNAGVFLAHPPLTTSYDDWQRRGRRRWRPT